MDELTESTHKALEPAAWVDQHGDYLYRYAVSRLRDGNAADEVVQEAFLSALRHTKQYAGTGSERAWLLGILKRKIIDYVRQRSRTSNLADDDASDLSEVLFDHKGNWKREAQAASYQPLQTLERQEFWRILRQCLDTLPSRQADVFVLRAMDDQNTEEICKELKISTSNLWVLLFRARLRLAKCMKNRWIGAEDQEC